MRSLRDIIFLSFQTSPVHEGTRSLEQIYLFEKRCKANLIVRCMGTNLKSNEICETTLKPFDLRA